MAGVRERKKEILRQKILQAAQECFLTDGFADTTIADIAAKANIGVGTLYNYFPSKAILFLESYFQQLGNPKDKLTEIIHQYGDDPASTIAHITEIYLEPLKQSSKTVLREIFGIAMDSLAQNQELAKIYTYNDYLYIDFLADVLQAYQEKGALVYDFGTKDAAFCLYSIIMTQSLFYILDDTISFTTVQENILRQIKLFFLGKVKVKGDKK
ncbi:MAG: TetR/AcrR family transcriptional regulator [Peptococcaceae bacterium]|nr:TetR/AcrR family transcriptional regulator [Peptococcaceae bacterium]